MKFFYNLKNIFDFFLRRKLKFSLQNYEEAPEDLSSLFGAELKQRENDLKKKYYFDYMSDMTQQNYKENLYMIDVLDKYFNVVPYENLKVLDIGCKNWNYVRGQYTFFKKYCKKLELKGVEIDAYRLYWNLFSRYEVAKFYKRDLPNTRYIPKDFMRLHETFDYITWFLPFIREYPHMRWGLPLKYYKPEKMLWHAYFSLKQGGKMFIVNQSEFEYDIQKNLLDICAIPYQEKGEIISDFLYHKYKRFALVVTKNSSIDTKWLE